MSTLKVSAINNAAAGSGGLAISADGNVSGAGMDLITSQSFTAASTVSVDDCFTADYAHYLIVTELVSSASAILALRPRASGTDATSNWSWNYLRVNSGAVSGGQSTAAYARLTTNETGTSRFAAQIKLFNPQVTGLTSALCEQTGNNGHGLSQGIHTVSGSYDGFTLYPASGNITGALRVYGYRN
jgi:hypothetical protein